ncbi:MAG: hypothetical protein ACJ8GJ_16500 [Vitreoscilla sp.]
MITKTSAGGLMVSGAQVKADLYIEANKFCADKGLIVDTVDSSARNAIPFARMPSAELHFRCVAKPVVPVASSSPA